MIHVMEFSTRSIHRLIKSQGDKRVSETASMELGEILERFAGDLAEEAIALANEQGSKTVKDEHIRDALNR